MRVYFSMQDTITPVKVGVIAIVINIILNLILVQFMAHAGLARVGLGNIYSDDL